MLRRPSSHDCNCKCNAIKFLFALVLVGFLSICIELPLLSSRESLSPLSIEITRTNNQTSNETSNQSYQTKPRCNSDEIAEQVNMDTAIAKFRKNDTQNADKNVTKYVLVTGAAGFIGSHVVRYCVALNMKVVAIDDLSGGFTSNVPVHPNIVFERGSVQNDTFIDYVFKTYGDKANHSRITYIYHLAAYSSSGLSHFIRRFNYNNNMMSSTLLINYAVNYKVQCFVFISSIAIYGNGPYSGFTDKFTEDLPGNPQDPYGISKYAVELDLKSAHSMFGLNYVIFRPHNVYGPNQNIFDKYRNVLGIFMYNLLHNKPMKLYGDGLQTLSFSYIDDVAPYIALSPLYPHLANHEFNIGAQRPYTLNTLCKLLIKTFISNQYIKHVLHEQHHPLSVIEEYNKLQNASSNMKMDKIIATLYENKKVVQLTKKRNDVANTVAAHDFFHCMFKIDESKVVDLEHGLNETLKWVLSTHYNVSQESTMLNHRYLEQSNVRSVEIMQNLPKTWGAAIGQAGVKKDKCKLHISKLAEIKSEHAGIDDYYLNKSAYIDGSKGKPFPIDPASWGTKYNLTVWCAVIVFHHNDSRLRVIEQTWGKKCDKLYFVFDVKKGEYTKPSDFMNLSFSFAENVQFLPIHTKVADGLVKKDLWEKMWKLIVHIFMRHGNEFDYLLKADTDTWFSVPNFKAYATYFNPQYAWYMGHTEVHYERHPFQAGGNYALSRGLIRKLVTQVFNTTTFLQSKTKSSCRANRVDAEDYVLGQCLQRINVWPLNTLNEKHQLRWSPLKLHMIANRKWVSYPKHNCGMWWYFTNRFEVYPDDEECCDEHMISLHDYKYDNMETLKENFEKLDKKFTLNDTESVKVPALPTTFLFGKTARWRHDQIKIELV